MLPSISHYGSDPIPRHELPDCALSRKLVVSIAPYLNAHHDVNHSNDFWVGLLQPSVQILLEQLFDARHFLSNLSNDDISMFFNRPLEIDNPSLDFEYRSIVRSLVSFLRPEIRLCEITPSFSSNGIPRRTSKNYLQHVWNTIYLLVNARHTYRLFSRFATTIAIHLGLFRGIDVIFIQKILPDNVHNTLSLLLSKYGLKSMSLFNVDILKPLGFSLWKKKTHGIFRAKKVSIGTELGLGSLHCFLESFILKALPSYSIEDFHYYFSIVQKFSWSHIVCKCPAAPTEPLLRFFIAQKADTSQVLVTFQHGGGYGLLSSPHFELEYLYSDVFYRWFNSQNGVGSIVHPTITTRKESQKLDACIRTDLLIIGTSLKSFFRYNLGLLPESNSFFIQKLSRLISLLSINGISVTYRPYTDNPDYLCELLPSLIVDRSNLSSQVASSRAVLVCKPTTVIEQVLLLDRLPFLFWGHEVGMEQAASARLCSEPLNAIYSSSPEEMCKLIVDSILYGKGPCLTSMLPALSELFGTSIASPQSIATNIYGAIQQPSVR